MAENPHARLVDRLVTERTERLRRGFWILAAIASFLSVAVTIARWIHLAELRVAGHAGTFDGLGSGFLLVAAWLALARFYGHVFGRRADALASEGQLVAGRLSGEPAAWGVDYFPETSRFRGIRKYWSLVAFAFSDWVPSRVQPCVAEIEGKSERLSAGLFLGEKPLSGNDGEILLLVHPRRLAIFPSPTLICVSLRDPDYQAWRKTLQELVPAQTEPDVVAEAEPVE